PHHRHHRHPGRAAGPVRRRHPHRSGGGGRVGGSAPHLSSGAPTGGPSTVPSGGRPSHGYRGLAEPGGPVRSRRLAASWT
ncbi:hypothetical protein ABTC48_21210, partial [Acinetobacter baumannii]